MYSRLLKLLILFSIVCFGTPAFCELYDGVWLNDARTTFLRNKAIILAVNIRTFGAQDNDGNDIIEPEKGDVSGNFVNAVARLDEIKKQGINTLHLLPITPVGRVKALGTAGSLYAISDFSSLNPQLDDKTNRSTVLQEARNFVKECHKRNIRVIVDLPSCGSYDLYLANPNLFQKDADGQPIVPFDWTDVRLFKTLNDDGSVNDEVFQLYKNFVDMVQKIGVDGIRADVATSKPFDFWKNLISYAQKNDREFLFIAEASESWNEPVAKGAPFTPYYKLLEAGFDGWYGSFFDFKDWDSASKFGKEVALIQNIRKDFAENKMPKSVIGSFVTHDEQSAIITGGLPFSELVLWVESTLPINSYFVDGFQTGDSYHYKYANQKANKTETDDDYFYVHKGKFDIFNFSRRPGGIENEFAKDFVTANQLKMMSNEILNNGSFDMVNTGNSSVIAYTITYKYSQIFVIFNKDLVSKNEVKFQIKGYNVNDSIVPIKVGSLLTLDKKNNFNISLKPGEVSVLLISKQNIQNGNKKK